MGTVFKKSYTKPLPPDSEIIVRNGQRLARWKDGKGKTRTAQITTGNAGRDRITLTASTFTAKFRDGDGFVIERPTGCKDETAARGVLAELERRSELVKANVITKAEGDAADHQVVPMSRHLEQYVSHLRAKGDSERHITDIRRLVERLMSDCSLVSLRDIHQDKIEGWLANHADEGMAARTRNSYLQAIRGMCGWCVQTDRFTRDPLVKLKKADENGDRRRKRRALTEEELCRLLDVARRRPLWEATTVRRGKNKGKPLAKVRQEVQKQLERLGWERALIYKTMLLTGLRKGELASLTIGQLHLDGPLPWISLNAADEKSREGSDIPLRDDLAQDLREWLALKTEDRHANGRGNDGLLRLYSSVASERPASTQRRPRF
jgi:integrase